MRADLDALKRARAEAQKEPNEFVFGGEVFTLPFELPLDFLEVLLDAEELINANGGALKIQDLPKLKGLAQPLLDGQAEKFFALHPSPQDYIELFQLIGQVAGGGSLGESSASGPSSEITTKTSRPASRKSTRQKPRSPSSSSAKTA